MKNASKNSQSYIYNALLKHGHSNFSLTILEYCSPDKCLEREDYYLCSLPHEYNIAKKAGAPFTDRKHSNKTKTIMSDAKKGESNPMFGKTGENHPMFGKNHSDESKTKISDAKKGQARPVGSGSPSQAIEVTDIKKNISTCYDSIREAARALNIRSSSIDMYFKNNQQKPYKGQYTFKKL